MFSNERNDDVEIIRNPQLWPMWPYLPLKRPTIAGFPECRLAVATAEPMTVVRIYKANLFNLPPTKEEFENTFDKEYESPEEVVWDGWQVD